MALEQIREQPDKTEHLKHIRYSLLGAKYELEQAAAEATLIHLHTIDLKVSRALEMVIGALTSDALKP